MSPGFVVPLDFTDRDHGILLLQRLWVQVGKSFERLRRESQLAELLRDQFLVLLFPVFTVELFHLHPEIGRISDGVKKNTL